MATDWHEMDAGDELDLYIAEHAGKTIVHGTAAVWGKDCKQEYLDTWIEDENGFGMRIPAYSTSVDAAMTLPVDKITAEFSLWQRRYTDRDVWWASFYPNTDPSDSCSDGIESGPTPALAICRAWLSWRGAQHS